MDCKSKYVDKYIYENYQKLEELWCQYLTEYKDREAKAQVLGSYKLRCEYLTIFMVWDLEFLSLVRRCKLKIYVLQNLKQ